jgi:hypothetical protein
VNLGRSPALLNTLQSLGVGAIPYSVTFLSTCTNFNLYSTNLRDVSRRLPSRRRAARPIFWPLLSHE